LPSLENDPHRFEKNNMMRSFLPALALCAVLQPALADSPAGIGSGAAPAAGLMQAALKPSTLAPSASRVDAGAGAAVVVAGLKSEPSLQAATGTPPSGEGDGNHPTGTALLLAGLVVMTGIALRHWGMARP
jgi:hypothetical protein